MTANMSPVDAKRPGAAEERPAVRRGGAATSALRRPGLLAGIAALGTLGAAGVGAWVFAPELAGLRARMEGAAAPSPAPAAEVQPQRSLPQTVAPPRVETTQAPAPVAAAVSAAAASEDPADPWVELRSLVQEAAAPVARAEVRSMGDERAEQLRLAAGLRDLGLLVRQGLEGQVALRKELARVEAEQRAQMEGAQSRMDTLNLRIAFAGDARASAAPLVPMQAAPVATGAPAATGAAVGGGGGQQAQPAAQRQRLPWETPGHVPPRSLRSPASAYQISDASADMALLYVAKPAPGQPSTVLARVGTEVPGLGRVTKIERRTTGWEVHTDRGGIVTQ